jgi:hypothetical protein
MGIPDSISYPITGLNRPTGFQEVKAPGFLDIKFHKSFIKRNSSPT